MRFILLFPILFAIASCTEHEEIISYEVTTQADSLRVMAQLLDSMYVEMIDSYIYSLKKSDMEKVQPVIVCGLSPRMVLKFNERGEHLIGYNLNPPITKSIYTTISHNRERNDLSYNYPLYSKLTKKDIQEYLNDAKKEYEQVKNRPDVNQEIVTFKKTVLQEWEDVNQAIEILAITKLPQIHSLFHIRYEYPENFDKREQYLDSIYIAFAQIRDESCKKHFHQSYLSLFNEYVHTKNDSIKARLNALQVLHPMRIVDIPYARANDIYISNEYYDVPPPVELPPMVELPMEMEVQEAEIGIDSVMLIEE